MMGLLKYSLTHLLRSGRVLLSVSKEKFFQRFMPMGQRGPWIKIFSSMWRDTVCPPDLWGIINCPTCFCLAEAGAPTNSHLEMAFVAYRGIQDQAWVELVAVDMIELGVSERCPFHCIPGQFPLKGTPPGVYFSSSPKMKVPWEGEGHSIPD